MKPKLHTMILKPVMTCNCACDFCLPRLNLYHLKRGQTTLTLDDWKQNIIDGIGLGLRSVHVSGGEPTLYPDLIELVAFCKTYNLKVNINTNGTLCSPRLVNKLKFAGLDAFTFSIYSSSSITHDRIKRFAGAHRSAIKAIGYCQDLGITTHMQTILTKYNMKSFDEILTMAGKLNINTLFISYLEGGPEMEHPTVDEIEHFQTYVVQKCEQVIREWVSDNELQKQGIIRLRNLFKLPNISVEEIHQGIYNPRGFSGCRNKYILALIIANGDVHPCNAVEYFHEPVVGNVKDTSITKLWNSPQWNKVRQNGSGWCQWCPINHHTSVIFQVNNDQ